MRTFLYNFFTLLFRLLLPLLAKFSTKVNLFYQGRKNIIDNLKTELEENKEDLFWVHCSSVGEFEQGLPVIELIKKEKPNWKVVVTFFSSSGYEAVNHKSVDYKFYLPIDTASNALNFVDVVHPQLAIFIKYEFWYHFLGALKQKHIPTYSVSSIFRPTQTFFKWHGEWNRRMLRLFTYFMVQDESSLKLLKSIGLANAQITGDTRFDRVLKIKEDTTEFPEIEQFLNSGNVFMVGSLRPEDDETIFSFINSNTEYVFIIAPHEITEKHLSKIENSIKGSIRHSQLPGKLNENVLIIDSIGKLSRLYRLANYAYIGGGFSDGIHNILEPAVYNIPIFFGNQHYKKYKEATDLVKLKSAFPISNENDLTKELLKLKDKKTMSLISTNIEEYVRTNKGAAQKVVNIINQKVKR